MTRTSTGLPLATVFGLALAASASASNFSVSGPGGAIPDAAGAIGTWNSSYTGTPFTSTVSVTRDVTSITKVTLTSFQHTWRGDLHIILKSPSASFNIVVRPGSTGATVGDSGDYLNGTYDFVESGGGTVAAGAANIGGGTYNQFFNTGTGQWTTGITNTPLSGITGGAGTWTLEIRDWAGLDVGSLTGWTLEGTDVSGGGGLGTPFCFGDAACPCPGGSPTAGCQNENGGTPTGGAVLAATGTASVGADTVSLNMTTAAFLKTTIFFESSLAGPATPFGDGLFCLATGGSFVRLNGAAPAGDLTDAAGSLSYPNAGHTLSITARWTQALGGTHPTGSFHYQAAYRDPTPDVCGGGGGTFNTSNALTIPWGP